MPDLSRWTFDARWDDRNIDANDYMVRHPDGEWVRYRDVTALLAAHPAGPVMPDAICPSCWPDLTGSKVESPAGPDLRAMADALRGITHPNEGPCPVCGHIFDAHRDGCPYDAIDLAIDAALAAATEPKAGEATDAGWDGWDKYHERRKEG